MSPPHTSTPGSGEKLSKKCPGRRSVVFNCTPINPLALQDESEGEEEERSARRKDAQLQKNLANVSNLSEGSNLKEAYVKEQYTLYSHLYMENKINPKNAWSIKIIDMLSQLCKTKESNNFQMAYTSIDIGTKVYGLRVDNVHSEVLKVARNMARITNEDAPDMESSGIPDGDDSNFKANTTKAPRKKRKKSKIIQDGPNAHLGQIPKLNPTDFTSRLNMEIGSSSSFLCTFLKEDATGCTYNILDQTKRMFEDADPLVTIDVKVPSLSLDPDMKVNLGLANFCIGNEGSYTKSLTQTREAVFDEDGIPLHELDGSIPDVFNNMEMADDDLNGNDQEDNLGLGNTKHTIQFDFRDVDYTKMSAPSEYGFYAIAQEMEGGERSKYIDHIWAGSSHWKLKCIQRKKEMFSGKVKGVAVKKKYVRKIPVELDFSKIVELDLSDTVSLKRTRKTSKYDRITCKAQKLSQEEVAVLLRDLILKPGSCLVERNKDNVQCNVGSYNYENLNDSRYCNDTAPENDGEDNNVPFTKEDCTVLEQQNCFDDLVEIPEKVAVANLAFSLKAKRMDMKKLKNAIWKELSNTQHEKNIEFAKVYRELPNSLTKDEKQNLSPHMAFVAALHICNEKSLYLTSEGTQKIYFCTGVKIDREQ